MYSQDLEALYDNRVCSWTSLKVNLMVALGEGQWRDNYCGYNSSWGMWMCELSSVAIHPTVVEIFLLAQTTDVNLMGAPREKSGDRRSNTNSSSAKHEHLDQSV